MAEPSEVMITRKGGGRGEGGSQCTCTDRGGKTDRFCKFLIPS